MLTARIPPARTTGCELDYIYLHLSSPRVCAAFHSGGTCSVWAGGRFVWVLFCGYLMKYYPDDIQAQTSRSRTISRLNFWKWCWLPERRTLREAAPRAITTSGDSDLFEHKWVGVVVTKAIFHLRCELFSTNTSGQSCCCKFLLNFHNVSFPDLIIHFDTARRPHWTENFIIVVRVACCSPQSHYCKWANAINI